ncbi:NAD(P)-binding domain-containing protein [Pluralibacter gergoviae]|uniref:NAD(P)-binding domain-containing protein n=1 Tax=Pluralibacter gergoviae TaxID=61647 RepID=A0AAI9DMQ8_PLUGE|nr:NAD(P)/FAD-dependent oxidoreductase [Pluralibacter gergoviae]EKV0916277.1 NAD(P)-binding domain-containing protein [Pluralibacter gergoviae]EKV9906945.1 NAD(P)-binding domain-containing protein [Pluralibacter gergoviae]EKW7272651.1 NAD(P)-binding domain-containing protein [Pluralibacter gergoviae]ELD4294709.1 NAD(P)-binding domain-containing protein [Pluralibacter gergoviae]ELD4306911.1 NAD(P)-binding domain-containing protein [Pluralibacter gergoviae]
MNPTREVIIVGAGPAGVGAAAMLRRSAVQDLLVVDSHEVGASFRRWPAETRFITPSFFSNPFGQIDLNAVTPDSSPALFSGEEHPGGERYAGYLRAVLEEYRIPVLAPAKIVKVALLASGNYLLTTDSGQRLETKALVWATGEFQFPDREGFPGASLCRHYADIGSWRELEPDAHVVIGGYESAVDAAVNLLEGGAAVKMLTRSAPWSTNHISDPSISLSPYSRERLAKALNNPRLEVYEDADVCGVSRLKAPEVGYLVRARDGRAWRADHPPVLATGFRCGGGATQIAPFFAWSEDGYPRLTPEDGSTLFPGLYLVGPHVRQAQNIYCFIYKFRQRFPLVAAAISRHLGLPVEGLLAPWADVPDAVCCPDVGCDC